ncbi:MAG TPA: hypothetical protein VGM63_10785, partial [Mucilaginibacter sp.]
NFVDFRPAIYNRGPQRIKRKIKTMGRELKMKMEFNSLNYKKLVDRIVEIDENENLYKEMLLQPWFNNNRVPAESSAVDRWVEIFNNV